MAPADGKQHRSKKRAKTVPLFIFSKTRQQLTYGVVSEGVFAESLRKFCGNSAESSRKRHFIAPGKGAESLRKFHGNLRKIFCNDPFPNDPISAFLTRVKLKKHKVERCELLRWRPSMTPRCGTVGKVKEVMDLAQDQEWKFQKQTRSSLKGVLHPFLLSKLLTQAQPSSEGAKGLEKPCPPLHRIGKHSSPQNRTYTEYVKNTQELGRGRQTKKEHKPKLFGPDIFRWGGGLPRERVGARKFGMSLETQANQTFGRDIPGFCRECPKSLRKKGLCSIVVPYFKHPKNLLRLFLGNNLARQQKKTSKAENYPGKVISMLVLKGIFGRSLKTKPQRTEK